MPNAAANVLVGTPAVTGSIKHAPTGTALPTNATTAENAAFTDLGYISDEGVTQSIGRDSNDIVAWGGDVVRVIQTSHTVTYAFTMIETNPESLEVYYGSANVDTGAGDVARIKSTGNTREEFVINLLDGANQIRIVIPDGEVTEQGDLVYATEDAIGYPVTITAYPDATGTKAYKYFETAAIS